MEEERFTECELCGKTAREEGSAKDIHWVHECLFCGWYFTTQSVADGRYGEYGFRSVGELNLLRMRQGLPPLMRLGAVDWEHRTAQA